MNCSKLILATALLFSAGAFAKPIVIGEPSKGTPVTTLKDGNAKVEITTTGISVDDGDEDKAAAADADSTAPAKLEARNGLQIHTETKTEKLEDILVPITFFLVILAAILGAKYISSRNEQRRLDLLKMMVEKGQPVPDSVINSILAPQATPESGDARSTYKRYRNAYGFSIGGFLLVSYAMLTHSLDGGAMITGLVFLCLGAGGLAGLYLPKHYGNATNNEKV